MRSKLFALAAVVVLSVAAVGPGLASTAGDAAGNASTGLSVAVHQDGGVTVAVTENGSGVPNAAVDVNATGNRSYAGTGTYTTGDDGTVALPAPARNVTVAVTATADNQTATTTATLTAADTSVSPFGLRVSSFVHSRNDTEGGLGPLVAAFVTANNPGHAPEHAGPPAWAVGGNDSEEGHGHGLDDGNETGNATGNGHRGPPDDAGHGDEHGASDSGHGDEHGASARGGHESHDDGHDQQAGERTDDANEE